MDRMFLRTAAIIMVLLHITQAQLWPSNWPFMAPAANRFEPPVRWGSLEPPASWPMQPFNQGYRRPVPQSPTHQCRHIGACKLMEEGTTIAPVARTTTTTTTTPTTTVKPTSAITSKFNANRPLLSSLTSPRPYRAGSTQSASITTTTTESPRRTP